jgi:asparagine synthase (glutamine-hydrolysing)
VKLKCGSNYLGVGFILAYFEQIRAQSGSGISYFTGEGGNTVPRDIRPAQRLRTLDQLVHYILTRNQLFGLDRVAALTRISRDDILGEIRHVLAHYPESDFGQRYVHFLIYEKSAKLTFEAEDRNRSYFWSVAPFFAMPVFAFAMACPPQQKAGFRLYRRFLLSLSPEVFSISHANWRVPISSAFYVAPVFWSFVLSKAPSQLKRRVKDLLRRRENTEANEYRCLSDQLKNCRALNDYVDCRVLHEVIQQATSIEMKYLLTMSSFIDACQSDVSTLERHYLDVAFAS